jgi:hypothetical protein
LDNAEWAKSTGWVLLVAMITFPCNWHIMPSRYATRRVAVAVLDGAQAVRPVR